MSDLIWLTDAETKEPALFRAESIDAVYPRIEQEESFGHMGAVGEKTTHSETRVLMRTGSYIAVLETPKEVYDLIRGHYDI